MKWIITLGFTGWSAIVALAWWLADRRIGSLCRWASNYCDPQLIAQRDAVLIGGLTAALVAALLIAVIAQRGKRLNQGQGRASTIQAAQRRLD